MLTWRGRVVAATQAWWQISQVDRGLLVAIASCVGPLAFGESSRTLALEDLSDLWLRPKAGGDFQNYRMLNVRLYADANSLPKNGLRAPLNARELDGTSLVLSVLTQNSSTFFAQADVLKRLRENAARLSALGGLHSLWQKLMQKPGLYLLLCCFSPVIAPVELLRDI